jgi:hypothetical protein
VRWRRGSRFRAFAILFTGATLSAQDSKVPRPEDYPVDTVFTGTPAAPKFATPGQRRFRPVIRDGAQKGANFAGHYAIVEWGCGTACVQIAVVDLQWGDIYEGPFGALPKGTLYLGTNDDNNPGISYHRDSSLLVVRGCLNWKDSGAFYFDWTGTRFNLLRKIAMKKPLGCDEH